MSFGFGAGDILAVGTLALKLYVSYREGPREFKELSRSLLSLHTTLDELQTSAETPGSILSRTSTKKLSKLELLLAGSREALTELEEIYEKYRRLEGSGKKISWTRLKFGKENLDGIRIKLGTHLKAITVFLSTVSHDALGRIETKMEGMSRIEAKVDLFYAELAEMKEYLRAQAEERAEDGTTVPDEQRDPGSGETALTVCRPVRSNADPGEDIEDVVSALQQGDVSADEV